MKEKSKFNVLAVLLAVLVIVFIIVFAFKFLPTISSSKPEMLAKTTLMKAVDNSVLSTAQFTYNGIAEMKDKDKVICHIKYSATIKAGIDMKDIDFDIDNDKKTIKPILPKITIQSNIVDEKQLSAIPDNVLSDSVSLKEAIELCREDAMNEAVESVELINSAEDSLKDVVEGLVLPIADAYGYSISWE